MRVLIVAANQEHTPDPVVPLGAAYIAAAARQAGHVVALYDACFDGAGFAEALRAKALAFAPQVIGLSIRNVDDVAWPQAKSYLPHYLKVVEVLRAAAPSAPLVLGGSAFTLFPEAFIEALGADWGVVGEGERLFVRLLADLEADGDVSQGVYDHGASGDPRLLFAPRALRLLELRPAFDLVDLDRYLQEGGAVNLQSKRGCAFKCDFCTYPQLEGTQTRAREVEAVVDEMEALVHERGVDFFFIVDNTFNTPKAHARALCQALIRRDLGVAWTAYATPAGLDAPLCDLMARAGCRSLDLGTDAAHAETLKGLGKSFKVKHIEQAAAACHAAGIRFSHSLILGGPGETMASLEETRRVIEATQPSAVIAILGARVYRHTALARRLIAAGLLRPEEIGVEPLFYIDEAVRDELVPWAESVAARHPRWWFPGLVGAAREALFRRLRARGVRGPLWALMR
ncbi:cobalamin-dependent protein [Myxococcota bacterium]|nr:cobalamin-dependent protein [Myxococcota bacterium]